MAKTKLFIAAPTPAPAETSPRVPAAQRGATRVMKTSELLTRVASPADTRVASPADTLVDASLAESAAAPEVDLARAPLHRTTRVMPIESLLAGSTELAAVRAEATAAEPARQQRRGEQLSVTLEPEEDECSAQARARDGAARAKLPGRPMQLAYAALIATAGVLFLTGPRGRAAQIPDAPAVLGSTHDRAAPDRAAVSITAREHGFASHPPPAKAQVPDPGERSSRTPSRARPDASETSPKPTRNQELGVAATTQAPPESAQAAAARATVAPRAAVEALAAGDHVRAASLYEGLAAASPDAEVYREAARILRQRVEREAR
jgi:hypothetical protein